MPGWEIDRRLQDVYTLYQTPDEETARTILDQYNVKYVVLGALERQHYPPEGLPKFDQMVADGSLRVAYQNEGTTIYEVVQ
jgi:uncharacterized membrane protein